jgi:hypothetical protein
LKPTLNSYLPSRKKQESNQVYYQKNKVSRNEKAKEKFNCECGGKFTLCNKYRHLKSKKHQAFISLQ